MKQIPLTQGNWTQVNNEDYDYLMQWNWQSKNSGKLKMYAIRYYYKNNNERIAIYMHKEILINRMGLLVPGGYVGDHKDRNRLNNQQENLRVIIKSMDVFNKNLRSDNTSGYTGVSLHKSNNFYQIYINVNKIRIPLGNSKSYNEAVKIRQAAELEYYGEILQR